MKLTKILLSLSFAAIIGFAGAVSAAENPFGMQSLDTSSMMQLAEGKCGEGKCGEGKCGKSGKCGEGKCGHDEKGKCGEGKCGGK
jgi:uncharacterized low-complexity protein